MFSQLNPTFVYEDVSEEILEHDDDVVSDLWDMNGRNVYRGARDPRYTHANVYWLYDESMQRVGCTEHSLQDHGDFRILWYHDDPFGTLFQEDWTAGDNIWSKLPNHVFEKFLSEGWTTPETFLEHSLHSDLRIVTVKMILKKPVVYSCEKCGIQSLKKIECGVPAPLNFPELKKVWFVDDDLMIFIPPSDSKVFTWLQQSYGDDLKQVQEQEPVQEQEVPLESPQDCPEVPELHDHSQHLEPTQRQSPHHHASLPQSHPQTLEQPSNVEEEIHVHNSHAMSHQSLDQTRRRSV